MQQALNQLIQLLQQGITAIFKFVGAIWAWVFTEVNNLVSLPWASLPAWKLIVLAVFAGGAGFLLLKAGRELWESFERVLKSFAALLSAFVTALPWAIGAGALLFAGLWIAKTF